MPHRNLPQKHCTEMSQIVHVVFSEKHKVFSEKHMFHKEEEEAHTGVGTGGVLSLFRWRGAAAHGDMPGLRPAQPGMTLSCGGSCPTLFPPLSPR
jgi:hypothetical protein